MRGGSWASVFVMTAFVSACGGQSVSRGDGDDQGRSGGSSNGGSGNPSGGASGPGGSAGTTSCSQPLESLGVECDYGTALRQGCARGGCHNEAFRGAGLDLTANDMLIARVLDVPATFQSIIQPGTINICLPATCPPLGSTMLVDSRSPEQSWMIQKMLPFVPGSNTITDMGCGTDMPYPPGNTGFTEQFKACLIDFFLAIATRGRACGTGGSVLLPPPPPCPIYE